MMKQKLFIPLFILSIMFCACNNTNNDKTVKDTLTVVNNQTIQDLMDEREKDSLLNVKNILKNNKNNSLEEINRLKNELLLNPNDSLLDRLSFLACKASGESSEELGGTMVAVFEKRFNATFDYLFAHRESCLANVLMQEYSEELSVSQGEERRKDIAKFKKDKLAKVHNSKYSTEQIKYLNFLLEKIKPETFD